MIDLRSDVLSTPTREMWSAMQAADLGWASAGEDESLRRLERRGAELAGKDAALFVATGSMANLVAVLAHTKPGDQVVLEASSHILWCEDRSIFAFGGVLPRLVPGERARIEAGDVRAVVQDSRYRHTPPTSLLCLENTDNVFGSPVSVAEIAEPAAAARELGLSVHLDGARLWNACVALDADLDAMVASVDSAMISLNKGLGAPAGALLVGSASFVADCRRIVRRLGGHSIHQAGLLAAAALCALETAPTRLAADHRRAELLATLLAPLAAGHRCTVHRATNFVVLELPDQIDVEELLEAIAGHDVRGYFSGSRFVRFVTYHDIDDEHIRRASEVILDAVARLVETE